MLWVVKYSIEHPNTCSNYWVRNDLQFYAQNFLSWDLFYKYLLIYYKLGGGKNVL